jgi:hypothetical protein
VGRNGPLSGCVHHLTRTLANGGTSVGHVAAAAMIHMLSMIHCLCFEVEETDATHPKPDVPSATIVVREERRLVPNPVEVEY